MTVTVLDTPADVALAVATRVAEAIAGRPSLVLGLPTGNTPIGAYAQLRRLHGEGRADFSRVSTFNLDEFVGVSGHHPGSFRQFMARHLFTGVNIPADRIGFLDGTAGDLEAECRRYDKAIAAAGGVGLQLLGIGANGHIGFNEPADSLIAGTHYARLLESTRRDNALLFEGDASKVPPEALTMGVGSILGSEAILLIATGTAKAACMAGAVNGPVTTRLPASLLQLHRQVEVIVDRAAAAGL